MGMDCKAAVLMCMYDMHINTSVTLTCLSIVPHAREVHMLLILAGFVVNEAVARGLKHGLRHPRPSDKCDALNLCHSHGMPSSHTQCIAFALTLRVLLLLRGFSRKCAATQLMGILESVGLAAITIGVAISRVYLGYHFQEQVVAALGLGFLMACIWRVALSAVAHLYPRIADSAIGQWFCLTDTWGQVDPHPQRTSAKTKQS